MKISIIVPVYNVAEYLEKSLESLVNQTFDDYEIILVNDGSNDSSLDILNKYAEKYPEKIVVINKKNGGQASARNLGIEKARGEYVIFVDSDDYIDADTLKITYNQVVKTGADIVCFKNYEVFDDKIIDSRVKELNASNAIKKYILNQVGPCFKLIKKDIIIQNKLYFPKLKAYEDIAVMPAYGLFAKKITFIDDKLYYYLMRQGSTMNQTVYSEKLEHIFPSLNNLLDIFKSNDSLENYYSELEFIYIQHLLHGAALRFISFDNYENNLNEIISIMDKKFPKWRKNEYYKKQPFKYHIVCELLYRKKISLLKKIIRN